MGVFDSCFHLLAHHGFVQVLCFFPSQGRAVCVFPGAGPLPPGRSTCGPAFPLPPPPPCSPTGLSVRSVATPHVRPDSSNASLLSLSLALSVEEKNFRCSWVYCFRIFFVSFIAIPILTVSTLLLAFGLVHPFPTSFRWKFRSLT